jgi:hypothetical protein
MASYILLYIIQNIPKMLEPLWNLNVSNIKTETGFKSLFLRFAPHLGPEPPD